MKRSTKITSIIIIFFLIIATVIIGRTMIGNHFKKKFSKRPPPGIIVTVVEEKIFENIISTYGTAAPIQTQSFKIEKYEILKPIKFNQKIKKGEVVANLKNRKVIAQFDGIIGKKEFSEDIEVSKSSILVNLEDTSIIYCDVDIPEIFVPFIKSGLPVDIKFSGYKNKIYKGEVDSFSSRISEDTRSLKTRIKMDNSTGEILPGSFLEISIKYDVRESLSIPDTSTIIEGENVFIYKVNDKNKTMKTKIIIGDRYLGFVEVLNGLNVGDKIVAEGTKKVRPNLTIKPIEKNN
ncbi:efflux RND transporter periplasmic adaptor subunit [Candidatus Pelagibacter sp.]|nr:efflux RND transporter periplasmic adaptor subunit [Candidatus Pelagibacter sp.]